MRPQNRSGGRSDIALIEAPHREFLAGMRDQLPLLLGVTPSGLIFGVLALSAGIPPLAAQGFSLLVFAGSAQFVATSLIRAGAPGLTVVVTIFVVNLRHALYSASMAPHFQHLSPPWKAVLAWLLTDEAFAVASTRYRARNPANAHWYTLGTGMTLWGTWQLSTAAGIALGAQLPERWPLDFAISLTFLALLIPALTDRRSMAAAASAGLLAVAFAGFPYRLGLLIGATAGVGIGLLLESVHAPATAREGGMEG